MQGAILHRDLAHVAPQQPGAEAAGGHLQQGAG